MSYAISIAKDFSPAPAGRHETDGPFSGEAFRNRMLIPSLGTHDVITIQLDGAEGYGSSFLEEAFGGLIRSGRFTGEELRRRIRFESEDTALIQEILSYIDDAGAVKNRN